jgi:hypothetical protein
MRGGKRRAKGRGGKGRDGKEREREGEWEGEGEGEGGPQRLGACMGPRRGVMRPWLLLERAA